MLFFQQQRCFKTKQRPHAESIDKVQSDSKSVDLKVLAYKMPPPPPPYFVCLNFKSDIYFLLNYFCCAISVSVIEITHQFLRCT